MKLKLRFLFLFLFYFVDDSADHSLNFLEVFFYLFFVAAKLMEVRSNIEHLHAASSFAGLKTGAKNVERYFAVFEQPVESVATGDSERFQFVFHPGGAQF